MTTAKKMLTPHDLRYFTGTEQYFKHTINPRFVYTDGVRYFARNAGNGAYWFLDIAATEIFEIHAKKEEYFLNVKIVSTGNTAKIIVEDGNDGVLFKRDIEYTDCPDGTWEFFMIFDGEQSVMLVPSEY